MEDGTMKKVICVAAVIAAAVVIIAASLTALALINKSRFDNGKLPVLTKEMAGGDCMEYIGIGYSVIETCPLCSDENPVESVIIWQWAGGEKIYKSK